MSGVAPGIILAILAAAFGATEACQDESARRRNGFPCSEARNWGATTQKDYCSIAPRSRRRSWGAEAKDTCAKSCSLCLAGSWTKGYIYEARLYWPNNTYTALEFITPTKFRTKRSFPRPVGKTYTAELGTDGDLHWSDGDVWKRLDEKPKAGMTCGDLVPAHRCRSSPRLKTIVEKLAEKPSSKTSCKTLCEARVDILNSSIQACCTWKSSEGCLLQQYAFPVLKPGVNGYAMACASQAKATCGGSGNGANCIFPFHYKDRAHSSCTYEDSTRPWCATTLLEGSSMSKYFEAVDWGYCDCQETQAPRTCSDDISRRRSGLTCQSYIGSGHCTRLGNSGERVQKTKYTTWTLADEAKETCTLTCNVSGNCRVLQVRRRRTRPAPPPPAPPVCGPQFYMNSTSKTCEFCAGTTRRRRIAFSCTDQWVNFGLRATLQPVLLAFAAVQQVAQIL